MFVNKICTEFEKFQKHSDFEASAQLRFVDRNPKRQKKNRRKIGATFVATFTEPDEHKKHKIQLEPDTVYLKHDAVYPKPDIVKLEPDTVHLNPDTVETNLKCEQQTGRLQKVLADIQVATSPIPEPVRKQLVEVVKENLDAFVILRTDLGRTSDSRYVEVGRDE